MPHLPVHAPYLARVQTMHLSMQRTPTVTRCTHLIPFIVTRYTWLPANACEALAKCLQTPCNHPSQYRTCVTMCARAADQRRILQYRVWRTTIHVQCSFPRSLWRGRHRELVLQHHLRSQVVGKVSKRLLAGPRSRTAWYPTAAWHPTRHGIPRSADLRAASRPGGRDGADVLSAPQHQHVRPLRRWVLRRTNRNLNPLSNAEQRSAQPMLQSAPARARGAWHPTRHGILWAALHCVTMPPGATRVQTWHAAREDNDGCSVQRCRKPKSTQTWAAGT